MNKEGLIKIWQDFADRRGFILNPDRKIVEMFADGILKNEVKYGFKLCPCRATMPREKYAEILCPCNFLEHDRWKREGKCFCGLFFKKD